MTGRGLLSVRGLVKRAAGRAVLDGLDFDLGAAQTALVLGPNGVGKSTLLRVLSGYWDADGGEVSVAGFSLSAEPRRAKAALGYLPDGLEAWPDLRVSELVRLVRALRLLPAELPDAERLWHERLGVANVWAQRLETLSFGQRKRVGLFCALGGNPPLLLLDEPTNGLDPSGVELLLELFSERVQTGRGQLVATNDHEFADRVEGSRQRLEAGRLERLG